MLRDIEQHEMVIEYCGEVVRGKVADIREKRYGLDHEDGGCYLFRMDSDTVVDATRTGSIARFINHSCDPNSYSKVVSVGDASSTGGEDAQGGTKKIIIFAKRTIRAGDELVYDYQFPFEEDAIRCNCGAANCVGRMN